MCMKSKNFSIYPTVRFLRYSLVSSVSILNKLLTVSEVAKLLGVNRNFVYKLIKDGELQSYKIGSVKIRTEDLEVYIRKCQR